MQLLYFGLSLFLVLTAVSHAECAVLGQLVESLWTRLERIWESSLLSGPLKFLQSLRTFQITRAVIRFAIETFVKLPFNASLKVFDFVCETLIKEGLIGKPGLILDTDLSLILVDDEGTEKINLYSVANIANSQRYLPGKDLVIFIPGWTQKDSTFDGATQELVDAFNQRYDRMFAVLDIGVTLDNLYVWSAYNAREVGNFLGIALTKTVDKIPAERIHLIGAGLGAQIAGFAGKKYAGKTSKKIGRITGLDPSRPCFGTVGLDASAAAFVDIIHSSKLFGSFDTKGHVDFYANRISTVLPNKGCQSFFCLHQQAVLYLAESVIPEQEKNFCGVFCESRNRFEIGSCDRNEQIFMGLMTPKNARGSYYLNTNIRSPYGKCPKSLPDGNDNLDPVTDTPVGPDNDKTPVDPDNDKKPDEVPVKPTEPAKPDDPKNPDDANPQPPEGP